MRARHGGGHSIGLEIGKFVFSELLASSYKSRWRIGNDIHRCTLCGKCQMLCPVNAITVSRHNRTWTLNNRRCRQCLECIVKCPSRSLTQVRL
ncbi:4Fe-4S dicluster domain-containing protein [uncultured Methanobrevibacter sp.]|uniref:4Fe-4S dicluster domain-containing protein n=1 Tax=uncultured Methanobrevibacter sp. TaxID=253161 RepID=UPI0025DA5951|nr:4Fe-4S binding protein [uncultured Methanobrevibacter sp.]